MQLKANLARGILVSPEDIGLLKMHLFYIESNGYPRAKIQGKKVHLHKLILPEAEAVDHINSNPLDNRRENLRPCTQRQNRMNSTLRCDSKSGYKGVYKVGNTYKVQIVRQGVKIHVGTYNTAESAAVAYNAAATENYGEFAKLNLVT